MKEENALIGMAHDDEARSWWRKKDASNEFAGNAEDFDLAHYIDCSYEETSDLIVAAKSDTKDNAYRIAAIDELMARADGWLSDGTNFIERVKGFPSLQGHEITQALAELIKRDLLRPLPPEDDEIAAYAWKLNGIPMRVSRWADDDDDMSLVARVMQVN